MSQADLDQWARSPATQEFRARLVAAVEDSKEAWAAAHYTSEDPRVTERLNTVAIAGVDMLRQVIAKIDELKLQ